MLIPNVSNSHFHIVLGEKAIDVEYMRGKPLALKSSLSFEPLVAIRTGLRPKVVALGKAEVERAQQEQAGVSVVDLAAHPRVLIADFNLYEATLQRAVRRLCPRFIFFLSPTFVIHQADRVEGGLAAFEIIALMELASSAGAGRVRARTGRRLSLADFQDLERVTDGWLRYPSYPWSPS